MTDDPIAAWFETYFLRTRETPEPPSAVPSPPDGTAT